METNRGVGGPRIEHTAAFNFLASLINGNYLYPQDDSCSSCWSFNFLASLINGNVPNNPEEPLHVIVLKLLTS